MRRIEFLLNSLKPMVNKRPTAERNAVLSARKIGSVKRSLSLVPGLSLVELTPLSMSLTAMWTSVRLCSQMKGLARVMWATLNCSIIAAGFP